MMVQLTVFFPIMYRWVIPFDLKIAHRRRLFLSIWQMVCCFVNSLVSQTLLATGDLLFSDSQTLCFYLSKYPDIHLVHHSFFPVLSWWMKHMRGPFLLTYYLVWSRLVQSLVSQIPLIVFLTWALVTCPVTNGVYLFCYVMFSGWIDFGL